MEDLTLALVTLTSFVLLFVVAVFADRAGSDLEAPQTDDSKVAVEAIVTTMHADVA